MKQKHTNSPEVVEALAPILLLAVAYRVDVLTSNSDSSNLDDQTGTGEVSL